MAKPAMTIRIVNVEGDMWLIQHGKSKWYFSLPVEQAAFTEQILALTNFGAVRY